MPRRPRFVVPGQPLHVVQRGNDRMSCFVDDEDIRRFLALLEEASRRAECLIHAYVLMRNHVHLLVTPQEQRSCAWLMRVVCCRYARYFNDKYGRTGTLWEGRYRSTVIDSERYLLTCSRYIELNPVRAGVVTHPAEYPWSSYRHNASGEIDRLVTPHAAYMALARRAPERRAAYCALFAVPLGLGVIDAIRRATNTGRSLGPRRFHARITDWSHSSLPGMIG